MVIGLELDGRKPEAVDVHEFAKPWPSSVVEAHQITAVGLVSREFFPWILSALGGLVHVVVDAGILVALG